jgi:hypothetical protein
VRTIVQSYNVLISHAIITSNVDGLANNSPSYSVVCVTSSYLTRCIDHLSGTIRYTYYNILLRCDAASNLSTEISVFCGIRSRRFRCRHERYATYLLYNFAVSMYYDDFPTLIRALSSILSLYDIPINSDFKYCAYVLHAM